METGGVRLGARLTKGGRSLISRRKSGGVPVFELGESKFEEISVKRFILTTFKTPKPWLNYLFRAVSSDF
jgi:hypothetical protein